MTLYREEDGVLLMMSPKEIEAEFIRLRDENEQLREMLKDRERQITRLQSARLKGL